MSKAKYSIAWYPPPDEEGEGEGGRKRKLRKHTRLGEQNHAGSGEKLHLNDCGIFLNDCRIFLNDCGILLNDCGILPNDCRIFLNDCGILLNDCGIFLHDRQSSHRVKYDFTVLANAQFHFIKLGLKGQCQEIFYTWPSQCKAPRCH